VPAGAVSAREDNGLVAAPEEARREHAADPAAEIEWRTDMGESRGISTALAGKHWVSVTVVPTPYFVGLDQKASSELRSNTAIHEFMHDVRHSLGSPRH
jgi:hypothetical protein